MLSSCAAAERAADGALLFDADGMPIPLDGLFRDAEEPTRPFTRISPEEPVREVQEATASAEPASRAAHVSHARPKNRSRKQPFLRRRHDNLVEVAGLAACVAAATGVLALWPSPHTSGTSNVDGTSLLVHRGQTASRSAQPSVPVRPGPPDAATSKPGTSASPKPTTSSSGAPATTTPPGTTAPAKPVPAGHAGHAAEERRLGTDAPDPPDAADVAAGLTDAHADAGPHADDAERLADGPRLRLPIPRPERLLSRPGPAVFDRWKATGGTHTVSAKSPAGERRHALHLAFAALIR